MSTVNNKSLKCRENYELTSSLNNFVMCNSCGKQFKSKYTISKHVTICKRNLNVVCHWCNIIFKNRGNLATHVHFMHGDSSCKLVNKCKISERFNCTVCQKPFAHSFQLKYHIRRQHFNLKAQRPHYEQKKVNQVWFERVQNSSTVMEMKRTGQNILLMKKADTNALVNVNEANETIDLSTVYPTMKKTKVKCNVCKKMYLKSTYKKHFEEVHGNHKKFHCEYCNKSFKRSYLYLRHVCKLKDPPISIESDIAVTKIESLSVE